MGAGLVGRVVEVVFLISAGRVISGFDNDRCVDRLKKAVTNVARDGSNGDSRAAELLC